MRLVGNFVGRLDAAVDDAEEAIVAANQLTDAVFEGNLVVAEVRAETDFADD
jgi:hypothetical protein